MSPLLALILGPCGFYPLAHAFQVQRPFLRLRSWRLATNTWAKARLRRTLFVICAGIAVVAFGLSYLVQRAEFAKVDTDGITARVFFNIHKRCTWTDIADISARSRQNNHARGRYVVVERVSGRRLALPAPISTDVFPDPEFDQKLAAIRRAWRTSKAG